MKKYIFVIIALLISFLSKGQAPHPSGSVNPHPLLNKFVGDWKWGSGNDSVILHLEKQYIHATAPLDYNEECLVGWHKYIKNGVFIENVLQYSGSTYFGGNVSILAGNRTPTKLFASFKDITKSKSCDLYLTMIDSAYTQMEWRIYESRGLKPNGFIKGFTLPVNIVLIKQ